MAARNPFPLPDDLNADLRAVLSYWTGLRRGENAIPFADDLALSSVPAPARGLFLLTVFLSPERFRLDHLGDNLKDRNLKAGTFIDEGSLGGYFSFLRTQCVGTIEAAAPTFCRFGADGPNASFSRILLPLWGNGQISAILGTVDKG